MKAVGSDYNYLDAGFLGMGLGVDEVYSKITK